MKLLKRNYLLFSDRKYKSKILASILLKTCRKKKNSKVTIFTKNKNEILKRSREGIYNVTVQELKFSNGSSVSFADVKNPEIYLRGGNNDLVIFDEIENYKDIGYLVNSLALPTTFMRNGRLLITEVTNNLVDKDYLDLSSIELDNVIDIFKQMCVK